MWRMEPGISFPPAMESLQPAQAKPYTVPGIHAQPSGEPPAGRARHGSVHRGQEEPQVAWDGTARSPL